MAEVTRLSNDKGNLIERLASDPGIDPYLRRDTAVEIIHLRRKLEEAKSYEVDLNEQIGRLREALEEAMGWNWLDEVQPPDHIVKRLEALFPSVPTPDGLVNISGKISHDKP